MKRREQGTNWKLDFFFREPRGVFGKGSDVIELCKQNIDGQRDAKRLRELAEGAR